MDTPALRRPIAGVLVAIAVTTTMDATGLGMFSALPLLPLMALFWYLERLPRRQVGFVWGRLRHYGLATLYPLVVLGAVTAVSAVAGAIDLTETDWRKTWIHFVVATINAILMGIVTEEGFFRGWLWASLVRAGQEENRTLIWSSIAFALWHLSAVTLVTWYAPPPAQIPVYMVNAAVMGAIWGLLRWISGSVIVASVSHGLWNGGAYVFFGFGTKVGALGIRETALYGPEVGVTGLVLNLAFATVLWRWWKTRKAELD